MKLTSLQFTLLVTTLCVVAGGAYQQGRRSKPVAVAVYIAPTPAPAATPLLVPLCTEPEHPLPTPMPDLPPRGMCGEETIIWRWQKEDEAPPPIPAPARYRVGAHGEIFSLASGERMVYVTRWHPGYHNASCPSTNSKSARLIPLRQARQEGRPRCLHCGGA